MSDTDEDFQLSARYEPQSLLQEERNQPASTNQEEQQQVVKVVNNTSLPRSRTFHQHTHVRNPSDPIDNESSNQSFKSSIHEEGQLNAPKKPYELDDEPLTLTVQNSGVSSNLDFVSEVNGQIKEEGYEDDQEQQQESEQEDGQESKQEGDQDSEQEAEQEADQPQVSGETSDISKFIVQQYFGKIW